MSFSLLSTVPRLYKAHPAWSISIAVVAIGVYPLVLNRLYHIGVSANPSVHLAPRAKNPYSWEKYLKGARDVDTPWGVLRVYEWGDEQAARRVLFLPGISTPCIALAQIANVLADNGCRVMLVDHWGRGFSDAPDAEQVRFDGRLYASQIFAAITSSPISWTRTEENARSGFSIIGYSLGGALATNFASYYPRLVEDLVLIGPGGLLRPKNISLRSKIIYSRGWLPERLLQWLVYRRMIAPSFKSPSQNGAPSGASLDPATLVPKHDSEDASDQEISSRWQEISADCDDACARQIEEHPGFIPAFMSSMRYAPIQHQQHRWGLIGARLNEQRRAEAEVREGDQVFAARQDAILDGLRSGKVHMVLGETDSIIKAKEIVPDAQAALAGSANLKVSVIPGVGHDVAYTRGQEVADEILGLWRERGL